MLAAVVRQLARRLTPIASGLHIEETHGMAQRGGSVSARIDVELREPRPLLAPRVLLALERIEGARALSVLTAEDAAFISEHVLPPPGAAGRVPAIDDVARDAEGRGIMLEIVAGAAIGEVVQAAIARGALP